MITLESLVYTLKCLATITGIIFCITLCIALIENALLTHKKNKQALNIEKEILEKMLNNHKKDEK